MIACVQYDIVAGRAPTPAELAHYRQHGWVVLRGMLDPAAVAALREDVGEVLRARNMPESFLAQSTEYLAGSPLHRLVSSPALFDVAGRMLEGEAHLYMTFTAVKGPGQGEFIFHQDGQYTPFAGPGLNCWFALVDCSPANGGLRMVSGSQHGGFVAWTESTVCPGHRTLVDQPRHWEDIVMRAGDCCVFDRATVHGSGPNHSSTPRIAYAVQFHRSDTKAFFDGSWELLTVRPRFSTAPVAAFTSGAQKGE